MSLKIFNTLKNNKDQFIPLNSDRIKMYVCGPTVYDYPHIGNARSIVVYDVLYRIVRHLYGESNVIYVRNITDIDDKIIARASELGISIDALTSKTTQDFWDDVEYLHCLRPTHEPKATEHLNDMIYIIQRLIDNGNAYFMNDHVYYKVSSYPEYGALANRNIAESIAGARIDVDANKQDAEDFVLWKPVNDGTSSFDSPWGHGRPGWHIECSAMSYHYLGEEFDIHGGGADLMFPHHTNEIAQSCAAFPGSKFANYWVHNGFLTVNGEKMSKSLGNFVTVYDMRHSGMYGEIARYLVLNTHYRKPLDFTQKALNDAAKSLNYLYSALKDHGCEVGQQNVTSDIDQTFFEFLLDDMNTHAALSVLTDIAKAIFQTNDIKKKNELCCRLVYSGRFLGILNYDYSTWYGIKNNPAVDKMIEIRNRAKKSKQWDIADNIRNELTNMNIILEDDADRTSWKKEPIVFVL